jgi:hypothetical protein
VSSRFLLIALLASLVGSAPAAEPDANALELPAVGAHSLRAITPTLLELELITRKEPDPAALTEWNWVDAGRYFNPPPLDQLKVTLDGKPLEVTAEGFRRRPASAPLRARDLRVANHLYLVLNAPLPADAAEHKLEVSNPDGTLWPAPTLFVANLDPLRPSPAIHVNQAGYVPGFPKKAQVGYYLGTLGEMKLNPVPRFTVVDAATAKVVFTGALVPRPDRGFNYSPQPYQEVLEADFSELRTPGTYRLAVPGMGASLPFPIDEGIAMGFFRTYALGLYEQRCGDSNALPFTRFVHDPCHVAPAQIPSPQSAYGFTWTTLATKNADFARDPRHTAPQLKEEAAQLYPFVKHGKIDVAGGHHDAGDYSKYTINSAALVHTLLFTVDAIPGAARLDNLGLPQSGNGISDLLEEAKWEADYLAKLQDTDGGFYFLVYPRDREYESDVLPDRGDPQVVWPKNTSATGAAVAALAQCASSPLFRRTYPAAADRYLRQARLGWQFLQAAIAKHGRDGSYQKITFYGDRFLHDDEIAWAACELYLATGEAEFQRQFFSWLPDPADPRTFLWGWTRMCESWGCAIRSYAFAARTGRLPADKLDAAYLAKCEAQIRAAADDAVRYSQQNAYGTALAEETKRFMNPGWYFSLSEASNAAVGYALNPKPEYLEALIANMNYEGGSNPVNVTYLPGLGIKRQREIVDQYAQNDRRVLPPDGIPVGNLQTSFDWLPGYGKELSALVFPSDGTKQDPYPIYDRWADAFNVSTEFVTVWQARSLLALSVLVDQTKTKDQPWKSGTARIVGPRGPIPLKLATELKLEANDFDLSHAQIVWEGRDQQPAFGSAFGLKPRTNGPQWVEAEAMLPDGRRVFGVGSYMADSPTIDWVDGAVPPGAEAAADGGDKWDWAGEPAPRGAERVHVSGFADGPHSHYFTKSGSTLHIDPGAVLFAWVYLDPISPPREVMLTWNDGSAEHRAYWGDNRIAWGTDRSPGRFHAGDLPVPGRWVRLAVPAKNVGLEGSTLTGMGFTLFDGKAAWDTAGKAPR